MTAHRLPPIRSAALALLAAACVATPTFAVISVDSATRNTSAPSDSSAAAWNLEGQLGDFTGTPIAPNLFIAAAHASVAGAGRPFVFDGQTYTTTASYDLGTTDLRIFQIDTTAHGAFSRYATLYDANASGVEVGKDMFVAGRGVARGADYIANGELRGWYWGPSDPPNAKPLSWGRDDVDAIANFNDGKGDLVAFDFAQPDGIGLTGGDSGGGLFVLDNGEWKLAGVNYAIDGPWSVTQAGPYENADLFDARGLWNGTSAADAEQVPTGPTPIPASSYASRISSNREAIDRVFLTTGNAALVPEPTTIGVASLTLLVVSRRRTRNPS